MKRFLILILCFVFVLSSSGCSVFGYFAAELFKKNQVEDNFETYCAYTPNEENVVFDDDTGITFVNNMLMIVFIDGTAQSERDALIESLQGVVVETVDPINQYQIQIPEQDLEGLSALVAQVEANECVLLAHYDEAHEEITDTATPNDPWDSDVDAEDWSDSDIDGSNWWMEQIDAPGAWEYDDYFTEITIGIIDAGFDADHKDLTLSFPGNFANTNRTDDHGTFVAGIIGAEHNNKKGICGIVKNKTLLCYDVEAEAGQNWKTRTMIYVALVNAVRAGAKVINMSLGDNSGTLWDQATINRRAKTASTYMAALLAENYDFIIVQSAGNSAIDAINNDYFASATLDNCVTWGNGNSSPEGICSRILVVGAVMGMSQPSSEYFLTPYSNYGSQVDIAAPGGVQSANKRIFNVRGIYSTKNRTYAAGCGTSLAAPMVCGVAALVWSVDQGLSGDTVAEIVCQSTAGTIKQEINGTNCGMLNAKLAVEEVIRLTTNNEVQPEPSSADEIVIIASGNCNESITWSFDSAGTLTISGYGCMPDYGKVSGVRDQPWAPYCDDIYKVVVGHGIEELGWYNFSHCENLRDVEIADSVVNLGKGTFVSCVSLQKIDIPDSVTFIGWDVFYQCTSLSEVKLSSNLQHIGFHAFFGCTGLKSIEIPAEVTDIGMNCFKGCSNLREVYFHGAVPSFVSGEFHETHSDLVLYYIQGNRGWTSPKWTAPDGTVYKTDTFMP